MSRSQKVIQRRCRVVCVNVVVFLPAEGARRLTWGVVIIITIIVCYCDHGGTKRRASRRFFTRKGDTVWGVCRQCGSHHPAPKVVCVCAKQPCSRSCCSRPQHRQAQGDRDHRTKGTSLVMRLLLLLHHFSQGLKDDTLPWRRSRRRLLARPASPGRCGCRCT